MTQAGIKVGVKKNIIIEKPTGLDMAVSLE